MRRHLSASRGTAVALALALAVAGCTTATETPSDPNTYIPGTLRVLASSELADMKPVLERVEKDTGLRVRPTYMGTLDAVELLAEGRAKDVYDAVWLSSNDYLRLRPDAAKQVVSETPVMSSPVAIGVKDATARKLGWKPDDVSWSDIEKAVADGDLTYGMTDPARSNSGFSTLVSVASGLSRRAVRAHRRGRGAGDAPAEGVLPGAEADVGLVGLARGRLRPAR